LLTSVRQKKAYYYFFPHVKKRSKDKYDFILGRDLLKDLGLDIQYSASQFVWKDIIVAMVPSGHWTKEKISGIATSWNTKKLKPALKTETINTEINEAEELHQSRSSLQSINPRTSWP